MHPGQPQAESGETAQPTRTIKNDGDSVDCGPRIISVGHNDGVRGTCTKLLVVEFSIGSKLHGGVCAFHQPAHRRGTDTAVVVEPHGHDAAGASSRQKLGQPNAYSNGRRVMNERISRNGKLRVLR
jgi:hypothetical protein